MRPPCTLVIIGEIGHLERRYAEDLGFFSTFSFVS